MRKKLPMRNLRNLQTPKSRLQLWRQSFYIEPASADSATNRVVKILDAKYEKVDLSKIVAENCSHLTRAERSALLSLLRGAFRRHAW